MTVKTSPLRLENIVITKEQIEVYPEYCMVEKFIPLVNFSVEFGKVKEGMHNRELDAIKFNLHVNRKKRKVPFKLSIEGIALFECDLEEETKKIKLLVYNGTVMIFGFLRGYVYAKLNILKPECRIIPSADIREIIKKALENNAK